MKSHFEKLSWIAALGMVLLLPNIVRAQGALEPTSEPGASMKSLQELWDDLQVQKAQLESQGVGLAEQQELLESLQSQLTAQDELLASQGEVLEALQGENASLLGMLQQSNQLNAALMQQLGVPQSWQYSTLDLHTPGYGNTPSITVSPSGKLAVGYCLAGEVRYAEFDQGVWTTSSVCKVKQSVDVALAFSPDGHPSMCFPLIADDSFLYAQHDGKTWLISYIDKTNSGFDQKLAFLPDGTAVVSYYDYDNKALKCAYLEDNWITEIVDSVGTVGEDTSLAISPDGEIAISYADATNGSVKFALNDGDSWTVETIDTSNYDAQSSCISYDPFGRPTVCFYKTSTGLNKNLCLAVRNAGVWSVDIIEEDSCISYNQVSLAYNLLGRPVVSFCSMSSGNNEDLTYGEYDGSTWVLTTLEEDASYDSYSSMCIGADGQPAIVYWDNLNDRYRLVKRGLFAP